MKFEEEDRKEVVDFNDLPMFTLFIGKVSFHQGINYGSYKSKLGPWVVVPSGRSKAIINLSSGTSIKDSLAVGRCWYTGEAKRTITNPVEVEGAVIRIPQKYLDLLK
jgi:hypothetical protein